MAITGTRTEIILPHDVMEGSPNYIKAREKSEMYVGWDIGKSVDLSAFVVMEHHTTGSNEWNVTDRVSQPPRRVQKAVESFRVRWIHSLPTGTLHPAQIAFACELMGRPELAKAKLIIDQSGKGDPVVDYAKAAGLQNIVGLTITGGRESTPKYDGNWNVSKQALFLTLDAHLQAGSFMVAPGCPEAKEFENELRMIRRHMGAVTMQFEAAPGFTDDRVCAAAYPLFIATRPPITPMAQFGRWGQV
jgi:hypothetical protein